MRVTVSLHRSAARYAYDERADEAREKYRRRHHSRAATCVDAARYTLCYYTIIVVPIITMLLQRYGNQRAMQRHDHRRRARSAPRPTLVQIYHYGDACRAVPQPMVSAGARRCSDPPTETTTMTRGPRKTNGAHSTLGGGGRRRNYNEPKKKIRLGK